MARQKATIAFAPAQAPSQAAQLFNVEDEDGLQPSTQPRGNRSQALQPLDSSAMIKHSGRLGRAN